MPSFYYKILTKDSRIKEGYIDSFSRKNAEKKLTQNGSEIVFLSKEKAPFFQLSLPFQKSGFSAMERINFFRNLSAMCDAGISIVEALRVSADQLKSRRLKKAILALSEEIKNGQSLSSSLAKFPEHFPEHLVETINVGDLSGRLTETFNRISIDLEKNEEIKKKVQSALIYPVIIIILMIAVLGILMLYVFPKITDIYTQFEAPLPLPTKIIIAASQFLTLYPYLIPSAIIAILFFFFLLSRTEWGRYAIHSFLIKMPAFGGIIKDYNLVLFFNSLKLLTESGISVASAVIIAKKTTKNDVFKRVLQKIEPLLFQGVPFADAIVPFPHLFPVQTQKILKIGDQTGKTDEMLRRVSDYYERSVDYKTRTMVTLIEPLILLIVGVVVGGIALTIFLPIYSLIKYI